MFELKWIKEKPAARFQKPNQGWGVSVCVGESIHVHVTFFKWAILKLDFSPPNR